jgi:hypothetical protein
MSGSVEPRHRGDPAAEWRTLTPEALRAELRANRRSERRLVVLGLLAAALTLTVVVLSGQGI